MTNQEVLDGLLSKASPSARRRIASRAELAATAKKFLGYLESGTLIRDISKDHEPGWAFKMMQFVNDLKKLQEAIAKAEAGEQEAGELFWFAQNIFNGLDTGMIRMDSPADETLANILGRGRQSPRQSKGGQSR